MSIYLLFLRKLLEFIHQISPPKYLNYFIFYKCKKFQVHKFISVKM